MTINEFLSLLTRYFFLFLLIVTLINYLLHRDKIRRDIALMIICLSIGSVFQIIRTITGQELLSLTTISRIAVLAQPYLLVRLVRYFRPVPSLVRRGALIGMVASWVLIAPFGSPLPAVVTLVLVVYFVAIDGYAVIAFIQGAFSSVGVTRQRLRFTAIGSGLLVAVLFLAGIRAALQDTSPSLLPLIQFLSILIVPAYYLGFAPPRWLRQSWQLAELRDYLENIQKSGTQTLAEIVDRLSLAVTRATGTDNVVIALMDDDTNQLVLQKSLLPLDPLSFPLDGVVQHAWERQEPMAVYKSPGLAVSDLRLMEKLDVEMWLIVPIATSDRAFGLLMVFLEYGSLFVDDDLSLLAIFAEQKAIRLQHNAMLEALQRHSEGLEQKVQERTVEMQRSNEELARFAYVASHDLQEPLRMVSLYLQLIENRYTDKLDDEGREFIGFAVDGAVRMKTLISDLLIFSRVETQSRNFTLVDCQKVLNETRRFLEVAINESDACITNDQLPQIKGDEQLIIQIFQNLISNAIKYRSQKRPEIHVGAIRENGKWVFSVRDNGIGMETQYLERIFIIFQRLHDRSQYPGTGIGLAICKKAVELHGGRIWAESEVDKGTTFFFTIPA
jgi:signal transduction histidine kinase